MPTYSYKCPHCSATFEELQSMKDEPLKTCMVCGADGVQRLIGAGAGLIFKGSGFYITDYKNGSNGNQEQPDKKDTKTEAKSDSKSDSKADSKAKPDKGSQAK